MMRAITFDTLEFTEQLKASGVPEEQAKGHLKAITRVLEQMEESLSRQLATKGDILEVKSEILEVRDEVRKLELKVAETKADLIKWMFGVAAGQAAFIVAIFKLFPNH